MLGDGKDLIGSCSSDLICLFINNSCRDRKTDRNSIINAALAGRKVQWVTCSLDRNLLPDKCNGINNWVDFFSYLFLNTCLIVNYILIVVVQRLGRVEVSYTKTMEKLNCFGWVILAGNNVTSHTLLTLNGTGLVPYSGCIYTCSSFVAKASWSIISDDWIISSRLVRLLKQLFQDILLRVIIWNFMLYYTPTILLT